MNDITAFKPHSNLRIDQTDKDEVGLNELLRIVQRRVWPLGGVIALVMALAVLALIIITPRYTAETLIMIESSEGGSLVSLESVVAGLSGDSESVQSEAYVLGSRSLAARVIGKLGLAQDPEFAPEEPGLSEAVAASVVVDNFLERLSIVPLEDSRVIAVRFSSEDADKAAAIANTIAAEYLNARLETKFELTAKATSWLNGRIEELREQVAAGETLIESTRGELGLLESDGMTLAARELTELNTQLISSRTALAEAEARLNNVQRLVRSDASIDTTAEVLESALIQRLREQQAGVQRRVAELSSELGKRHPRMIQLNAEAEDLRLRIEGEISKIITGLSNQVNIAAARVTSLESSLEGMKSRVSVANQNDVELRALEREAEANRTLLNTLLARQTETISQKDESFQQPDATVVSRADVPAEASYPRPGVVLGLAMVVGLLFGVLVVMIIELLDGGYRSGEQLEEDLGIPSVGIVPAVKKPGEFKTLPGYVGGRPGSPLGESMRTINWSLKLADPDSPPQVVLLTSSTTGEGKSTVASCLATSQSLQGQKVLLIDADIRQPSAHEMIGIDRDPGLTNVLVRETQLDDALVQSEWSNLTVLPAGTPNPQAPTLLGSEAMKTLLAELRTRFDIIIIDSPPALVATDARILCQLADATLLLARWGKTRRNMVRLSVRQLNAAGARLAGGVLTMVDVKRNSFYGFGDSNSYSGAMSSYFAS